MTIHICVCSFVVNEGRKVESQSLQALLRAMAQQGGDLGVNLDDIVGQALEVHHLPPQY
jgi:hypothetical protein